MHDRSQPSTAGHRSAARNQDAASAVPSLRSLSISGLSILALTVVAITTIGRDAAAAPIVDAPPGGATAGLVLFKFDAVAVGNPATAQVVFDGGSAIVGSAPAEIGGPVAVGSWGTFTGAAFAPTDLCCTNGPPAPPAPPPAAVPLPATTWLLVGGSAALFWRTGTARRPADTH